MLKIGEKETTYIEGTKVPSIRYHIFEKMTFIKDGFSTRKGGVSKGQFESMNFSVKMGDDERNVKENFHIFTQEHGFFNPVMADQTHTTNVKRVYREDSGKNVFCPKDYHDIDGLITDEANVTLVTTFADCVPLYFVDETHHAIGLAHSGWKGTYHKIGKEIIQAMQREFHSEPKDLIVAIGPSICVNCYEISKELAEDFAVEFQSNIVSVKKTEKISEWDMRHIVYQKEDRYYLNLWAANYKIFIESGIKEEKIALPDLCTCCNEKDLFSHRASKGKRGNLCAFLMMEE